MYTELEIVNHMLETCGEDTTATLNTQHPAVVQARSRLSKINKEFQAMGWWFNKQKDLKLLPDASGKVAIPADTLTFKLSRCADIGRVGERYVKRGGYVFDTVNHTNVINQSVWVEVCTLWAYEDLPPSAAAYLMHYAAEQAFLAEDGDLQVLRAIKEYTRDSWNNLQKESLRAIGANALKSPMAASLLNRPRTQYGTINPALVGGGQ